MPVIYVPLLNSVQEQEVLEHSYIRQETKEGKAIFTRDALNCIGGRLTPQTKDGKIIEDEMPTEISVVEDYFTNKEGPLWVKNYIEIIGDDNSAYEKRNRVTLCRCGKSHNKPFCDGQHLEEEKTLNNKLKCHFFYFFNSFYCIFTTTKSS
ncbi:hypothetical protein AZF37_01200 [endosymbiont 'TC1' of Trimyema compressum]|uniref:CDGSH iron-sulfur domain-containing protein n=1 Tax=endosymbiont 'TC1' of Trimyema compressum TaxID=243899 RepID=UPI0007F106C4|nr:CDGSH iron-sulfur domain-containing protein [endosymbiont 'TC1' of Trimyema compressum]AMP19982.1 hypothetical protein AZF37_01200 [endosymbiont 'TC1' of Trimyema compressum]